MSGVEVGQAPFSVLYEVWETNADLAALKLLHQGFQRDVAESHAMKFYKASGCEKDYYVWDRNKQEIVAHVLSAKTSALRGECLS
jgi:hypothetical protein